MADNPPNIIFLGNGRCYHLMDWFRSAQKLSSQNPPVLITDLIESESFVKLTRPSDDVLKLFVIDKYLLKKQSRVANIWRNFLKFLMLPIQVMKFREHLRKFQNPIVHAYSIYYGVIARFSSCKYVVTVEGSDMLVRAQKSKLFRLFAQVAFSRAFCIMGDSVALQHAVAELFGHKLSVIQIGIDVNAIQKLRAEGAGMGVRQNVISIRGLSSNYQINELLDCRNETMPELPIYFCYPFVEKEYRDGLLTKFISTDHDLGRLPRFELYKQLLSAKLVISIPVSDSSPRSIYEAIFCGCLVATTSNTWVFSLPLCMRSRIIVVSVQSNTWLKDAIAFAESNIGHPYVPSFRALDLFDQNRSVQRSYNTLYRDISYGIS